MGETGKEEYKIQSFDSETQKLLKTALKAPLPHAASAPCNVAVPDPAPTLAAFQVPQTNQAMLSPMFLLPADPSNVDLEKVANIIVDQSLKDCVFSKEAVRICFTIIQQEYKDREELRTRSLQAWICYVTFICNIFDYLRVNNMPMMALVNPVYDCLFRLAQPDSLRNEEEVDCLVLQLHRIGEQLEKMNSQRMDELFSLLRDGFLLQEGLSSLSQLLLLEIIEFRAADWKMTDAAQKYYYSEVTD
ncbi:MIF4G domain-containing protein [Acanthisitta chloris]|uniref:MIF4G domain-containing protein n=1 Tax=Acanthisitta chloris TaxID=57068 RepID=A0A091NH43_9PASS|nr:MIF4G domain-containing protein [Acanthisitta chloris]